MWRTLSTLILAMALAIFQFSFLSHLPALFSYVSFSLIAMTLATATDRPITAALWGLGSAFVLDLYGLFGFGTEIVLAAAVFLSQHALYGRVLTNASYPAAFALAAAGAFVRFVGLAVIDGTRVIFGQVPYVISAEPGVLATPIISSVVNGILVMVAIFAASSFKKKISKTFLTHAPNK
jgi:hypothetical protein